MDRKEFLSVTWTQFIQPVLVILGICLITFVAMDLFTIADLGVSVAAGGLGYVLSHYWYILVGAVALYFIIRFIGKRIPPHHRETIGKIFRAVHYILIGACILYFNYRWYITGEYFWIIALNAYVVYSLVGDYLKARRAIQK